MIHHGREMEEGIAPRESGYLRATHNMLWVQSSGGHSFEKGFREEVANQAFKGGPADQRMVDGVIWVDRHYEPSTQK